MPPCLFLHPRLWTSLSGFSFLPTSLLSVTLCTPLKLPSCWFQTLELKMLLNSDSRHRRAFPNLQICVFTLYSVIQIISETVDRELTLEMTLLKMPFQYDSKPLTATFGEGYLQVITRPLNEESYNIFMRTLHFLLIIGTAGETEQWNKNTSRKVAPRRALAPISWTSAGSSAARWLLHAGSRIADPRHRDLLAGMAFTAQIRAATSQRWHRSHHNCLSEKLRWSSRSNLSYFEV